MHVVAVLALAAGCALGQNTISLSSGSAAAGNTVSLDLSISVVPGTGPASLEWTYSYSTADLALVNVAAGPAAVAAGKSVSCNSSPGSYRCLLFGLNSTAIGNGVGATATFTVSPTTTRTSAAVQVTNISGATAGGTPAAITATGGLVIINPQYAVTGLACSPATVGTPGSAACTVTVSAPAPTGGLTVNTGVASTASVTIPSSVVIPAGSTTGGFTASASAVSVNTAAGLSASLNGSVGNFALTLAPNPYDSLVADWRLDGTSLADASGNANDGSCGSACPTLGAAGKVGTAASFNGTSSQIVVSDSPSLRLNQFTISLWVFPTQVENNYQPLVAKEDSFGANRNYGLYIVPNSLQIRYAVWAGDCATKLAANSSGQMALNTWNHIVFTYDGATASFYLNGALDSASSAALGGLCQAAVPLKIGMETSAFLPFSGKLDEIRIYSQALNAVQVASLHNLLIANWKVDEPSGATSFADASGNGNDGSCGSACPTLGAAGQVGTAASFNGTSSQIVVSDSPSLRLNQFTIALWVFPTQVKSDYQPLVAKEDSLGASRNYALYIVPNSLQIRYTVWAGDCATRLAANSSGQMALNTWNHIVFTYDGVTEKFYLNGVLDSATAAPAGGLCQAAVPVKIGMETSAFLPFSGTLDDIQIYAQALTAAQVVSLYSPLMANWKLNDPSGATSFGDASGNGNDGSCGSACPTLGVAGKVGTAASFNGSSSQIVVSDSPSLRLNQFTIALWVFPTQVESNYQPLVAKEDSLGANRNYALYIVPNSLQVRYAVWAADCATKLAANSSGQMALNTWNHIVFTYDGVMAKLYLNGVPDSAVAAPAVGLCQAAVPLKMGMETSAFLPFSGTLDDVRIYTQALTAGEVATLFVP